MRTVNIPAMGKGGTGALFVNGTKVAEGKIANTIPALISADETADVGVDLHTPVTPDYAQPGNEFTGTTAASPSTLAVIPRRTTSCRS